MESKMDEALEYMLRLTRHIPKDNISVAMLVLLIEFGFKTTTDGFCYLRNSILMKIEHPQMRIMQIYAEVGQLYGYGATVKQVERSIRHAIKTAWEIGNAELLGYFFSKPLISEKGYPADGVFICQMACVMELWRACSKEVAVYE